MSRVFRKPMTLTRVSNTVGSDGRTAVTTAAPVTVNGALRHRLDDRALDGALVVQQEQIVYLPAGTSIAPGDQLAFDGSTWEVIGNPYEAWSHRSQSIHHLEVRVRAGAR